MTPPSSISVTVPLRRLRAESVITREYAGRGGEASGARMVSGLICRPKATMAETRRRPCMRTGIIGICAILLFGAAAVAQEHEHGSGVSLGTVYFSTSCNEPAQREFDHAVAL